MPSTDKSRLASAIPVRGFPIGSVDARMIAVMRCLLVLSALAIGFLQPIAPPAFPKLASSLVIAYCLWSALTLLLATRHPPLRPSRHGHWIDVGFAAFLVALTQGNSSLCLFLFLFAILVASFSWGFSEGLKVTVAAVLLFELVSAWVARDQGAFDLELMLARPFYLLALGAMIAYWGGHEITHRRRLRLLQEINNQWNPRFGHDHAIGTNLERVLDFFSASACVLVLKRPTTPPIYLTYHGSDRRRGQAMMPSAITPETATVLLSFPPTFAGRYEEQAPWWRRAWSGSGLSPGDADMAGQCAVLANLLDASSFLTVPYLQRDGSEGRVFLTVGRRAFVRADVDFFSQLMTTIANVVEGMQLMDELVSRAADHERYRISLDIHDTTIQPYIGLKLGLDALAREAGADHRLSGRIGELLGMTETTISDLRRYMTTLQEDTSLAGDSLLSAVREQATHYHRFYGIEVAVTCEGDLPVNSQLAGALLQIVAEGLSNILRHTGAKQATITLHCEQQHLVLEIANEADPSPGDAPTFIPRSIDARTRSFGGTSAVERDALGYTIVRVSIPL